MPEIKKITLRLNTHVPEEKAVYEFLADRRPYRKIIMEAVDALRFRQSEEVEEGIDEFLESFSL